MIIYIVGYGRSGSTHLSKIIEEKLNATNLGEVKYLYKNNKNDLLDPYWTSFKQNNDTLKNTSFNLSRFDNFLGLLKWRSRAEFKNNWDSIFDDLGLNPSEDIIIDSSKTTLDSFMRGIYLRSCYDEVFFLKPKRNFIAVLNSLLKGKNSDIERQKNNSSIKRFLHILVVGLPHFLITKFLTMYYHIYGMTIIDLKKTEEEVDEFIRKNNINKKAVKFDLPIIYGNRSRKK